MLSALILNLSNHPHLNWPEKQLRAAQAYGNVIEILPDLLEKLQEAIRKQQRRRWERKHGEHET